MKRIACAVVVAACIAGFASLVYAETVSVKDAPDTVILTGGSITINTVSTVATASTLAIIVTDPATGTVIIPTVGDFVTLTTLSPIASPDIHLLAAGAQDPAAALTATTTATVIDEQDAGIAQFALPVESSLITVTTVGSKTDIQSAAVLTDRTISVEGTLSVVKGIPMTSTVGSTTIVSTVAPEPVTTTITIPIGDLAAKTPLTPITPPATHAVTVPQDPGATLTVISTTSRDAAPVLTTLPAERGVLTITATRSKTGVPVAAVVAGGTITSKRATIIDKGIATLPASQVIISSRAGIMAAVAGQAAKMELDQRLSVSRTIAQNNVQNSSFTIVSSIATTVKSPQVYMAKPASAK